MTTNNITANAAPAVATPSPPPQPAADAAPVFAQFPDFPPRADMMNTAHIHDPGNQAALRLHLGHPDTTIVLGEVPIHWHVPAGRAGVRIPDLLVAFNIRRAQIIARKGYSIREQGKPPDFVLEVASDNTANNDIANKRRDYARFGIGECWLFDPDWGQRYPAGLMAWILVNGHYEPITIHQYAPEMYYGYSTALGLYICWEYGVLRWYDPETGYLPTHDEERHGRLTAEARQTVAQDQRDAAQAERDAAREERDAAQAERDAAQAHNRELIAEIRRLRAAQ